MKKLKTLVIHVSHRRCPQFEAFIKRGLFESDQVTFILVRNDAEADHSAFLPIIDTFGNVHVLIRPNVGLDFQAWNEALHLSKVDLEKRIIKNYVCSLETPLYREFDRFIFLNTTILGPFLPRYVKDNWVDCFTSPLNSTIKLIGLTINHPGFNKELQDLIRKTYNLRDSVTSHIQSMIFATDQIGLEILLIKKLFSPGKVFPTDKLELIILHEIAMTSLIFDAGYEVFSMALGSDQGRMTAELAKTIQQEDPWLIGKCKITSLETMFLKINRGIEFKDLARFEL